MTLISCNKFQNSDTFRQFSFAKHMAADYVRMLRLSDKINDQTGSLDSLCLPSEGNRHSGPSRKTWCMVAESDV